MVTNEELAHKIDVLTALVAALAKEVQSLKPSLEPPPVPPVPDNIWATLKLDDPLAEVVASDYGWVSKNTQMAQYDHDEVVWRAWRGEGPDSRILDHGLSIARSRKYVLDNPSLDEVSKVEVLLGIRKTVLSPLESPKPQVFRTLEAWWDSYMQATRGGTPGISVGGTD